MTEKEQEFDQLIRKKTNRPMKACRCFEAMLEGYRKSYYRDDGCMYIETEPRKREPEAE
jgi:hypothetical protein